MATDSSSILYSVAFTCIHVLAHFFLYVFPRYFNNIITIVYPSRLLDFFFDPPQTLDLSLDERRIAIVGPIAGNTAAVAARERFGIPVAALTNLSLRGARATRHPPSFTTYMGPLYNGHVHTILGAYRPPNTLRRPQRFTIPASDGNTICLDFWIPQAEDDPSPATASPTSYSEAPSVRAVAFLLPGLTGSSDTFYVRRMTRLLLREGVAVWVLNARGVGTTPLSRPQIFSALFTEDIRDALLYFFAPPSASPKTAPPLSLQHAMPSSAKPLIAIGFSLGGLILSHYAAEQGKRGLPSYLDAAISITSPHSLTKGAMAMRRPLTHLIYGNALYGDLKSYYLRHKSVIHQLPGINSPLLFSGPEPLIERLRSIQDFDEYITGPHFGFTGAEAYYAAADTLNALQTSTTPQICIVAANDPICGSPLPLQRWQHLIDVHAGGLIYVVMPVGGHLGFLGSPMAELSHQANPMETFVMRCFTSFVQNSPSP